MCCRRCGIYIVVLFVIIFLLSLNGQAALELRGTDSLGNRLIYDSDLDITWYDYSSPWNSWFNQMNWASTLTVNFADNVYDDWRLPISDIECFGLNCSGSEMGHLYYIELGNEGLDIPVPGDYPWGLVNTSYFRNLNPDQNWSSSQTVCDPPSYGCGAWTFDFGSGRQGDSNDPRNNFTAVAVRSGNVTVVPEPISFILIVTGALILSGKKFISNK